MLAELIRLIGKLSAWTTGRTQIKVTNTACSCGDCWLLLGTLPRTLILWLPERGSLASIAIRALYPHDSIERHPQKALCYGRAYRPSHNSLAERMGTNRRCLNAGAALEAAFADGDLSFSIDEVTVIDRTFESEAERTFILVQWKLLATIFSITERVAGKKLCDALRKLATNDLSPVFLQIMALERNPASPDAEIARQERAMNALRAVQPQCRRN